MADTLPQSLFWFFLIGAFIAAVGVALKKQPQQFSRKVRWVILVAVLVIAFTNEYAIRSWYPKHPTVFYALWDYHGTEKSLSSALAQKQIFDRLADQVPGGASVTGTEWGHAGLVLAGYTL